MFNLTNPFSKTDAPDEMTEERRARQRHINTTLLYTATALATTIYCTPLIVYLWAHRINFSAGSISRIFEYLSLLKSTDPFVAHKLMLEDPNFVPGVLHIIPGGGPNDYLAKDLIAYIIIGLATIVVFGARQLFNNHKRMVMKQSANWMTAKQFRTVEKENQFGIQKGRYMLLGRWNSGLRENQPIRMAETLSTLCLAPPGTGKTAGVAVPTIIDNDNMSMIVYDAKPELFKMTGHHRGLVSDTHVIDWSKTDSHELIVDDEGEPIKIKGAFQVKHTIYSRFNPLCKAMVPPPGAKRETYLEAIANINIPREKKADYFTDQGRDSLIGFMSVLVAKINDDDDPNRWDDMPSRWHGKEASLPMLIDWYSYAQFKATQESAAQEGDKKGEENPDPLGAWLRDICDRADPDGEYSGKKCTTARGFSSLSPLVTMADRQRSGVLGTMSNALNPYRNAAVQQRMEASDFSPDDFRGVRDKNGNWRPFTLYICINAAESDAFSVITSMLFETTSLFLLSYGPNDVNPNTGGRLGPYPITFLMDEFARLKEIPAVLTGPDIGRSKKVSYLIIAQATQQIKQIYGDDRSKQIKTTTAAKIIFPQNEADTVKEYIATVGKTTIRRPSYSTQEGIHKEIKAFSWNRSDVIEETDLLRQEDLTSMPARTHILLLQGHLTRPIRAKTPLYYLDPVMRTKVCERGCTGIEGTEYVPQHIYDKRVDEWTKEERAKFIETQLRLKNIQTATKKTEVDAKAEEGGF